MVFRRDDGIDFRRSLVTEISQNNMYRACMCDASLETHPALASVTSRCFQSGPIPSSPELQIFYSSARWNRLNSH